MPVTCVGGGRIVVLTGEVLKLVGIDGEGLDDHAGFPRYLW
jgi:hypothetical protein